MRTNEMNKPNQMPCITTVTFLICSAALVSSHPIDMRQSPTRHFLQKMNMKEVLSELLPKEEYGDPLRPKTGPIETGLHEVPHPILIQFDQASDPRLTSGRTGKVEEDYLRSPANIDGNRRRDDLSIREDFHNIDDSNRRLNDLTKRENFRNIEAIGRLDHSSPDHSRQETRRRRQVLDTSGAGVSPLLSSSLLFRVLKTQDPVKSRSSSASYTLTPEQMKEIEETGRLCTEDGECVNFSGSWGSACCPYG